MFKPAMNDRIAKVRFLSDGQLEVVWRRPSNFVYATNPPQRASDGYVKQIFKIELIEEEKGTIEPAKTLPEEYVPWKNQKAE